VTQLRKMMLEDLQRRNYSKTTVRAYLHSVQAFAEHFHTRPDHLGLEHIRAWQAHLFQEKKLSASSVARDTAALRFFFVKTLRRPYPVEAVPYPKRPRRLPTILTPDEAARLINSASNLFHRPILMTLYATGMRRAELCNLKVGDIDSAQLIVHVRNGKGGRDRDIPWIRNCGKHCRNTGAGCGRTHTSSPALSRAGGLISPSTPKWSG